jgi:hypothetical protein
MEDCCRRAARGAGDWLDGVPARRGEPGLDERVVEYPWTYARLARHARLLDVGSTLNSPFHVEQLRARFDEVVFLNPYPDDGYRSRLPGVSYLSGDIRRHGLPPATFGHVTCLSTLEHIGCDNARYGGPVMEKVDAAEARAARAAALRSMRGLVAPGGSVLLTVPFGRHEDHGWFVQFDGADLEQAIEAFEPSVVDVTYFLYAEGWRVAQAGECADARYGERTRGAGAVACAELRV